MLSKVLSDNVVYRDRGEYGEHVQVSHAGSGELIVSIGINRPQPAAAAHGTIEAAA